MECPQPAIGTEVLAELDLTGRAVLFATGWDRYWRSNRYGDEGHPFLSVATAALLVESGAELVGID